MIEDYGFKFEKIKFEGTTLFTANHLGRLDGILIMGRKDFGAYPNMVVPVAEKYDGMFFWQDFVGDITQLAQQLVRICKEKTPDGSQEEQELVGPENKAFNNILSNI